MHPYTPTEPIAGEPILPWAQEMTRAVRALTPTSSPDIRAQVTPAGTSYHMARDMRSRNASIPVDTDGYDVLTDPDGRMTIEQNPEDYSEDTSDHSKERQLRNVHLVKRGSSSIPFFLSEETLQGTESDKIVGELYWATPDGDRYYGDDADVIYRSLDVADTHATSIKGKWNLSLYGFTGSSPCHAAYVKEVTNPAGSGRELEWRYPVAVNSDPVTDPGGTVIDFVVNLTNGTPPESGSYATADFESRAGTIFRGAINYSPSGASGTAYLPIAFDYEDINPNIEHNELAGSNDPQYPEWTATNSGHDGRYLKIGAGWSGNDYNNTCAGIAHATDGARGIDFANGLIYGDYFDDGAVMAYASRQLNSSSQTLWKVTHGLRLLVGDGSSNKWVDLIPGDGSLEIKDHNNNQLALFQTESP